VRDLLLTGVFLAAIIYALPRPWVGVLVWSWLGYMNPHRLAYGFAFSFPFAAVTFAVIVFAMIISPESKRLPLTREVVLLIVFVAWFTFTTILALNPSDAWIAWDRSFKIELMILVTLMVMRERQRLHLLAWVIALSLGFYGVKGGLFAAASGGTKMVQGPPDSFIEGNNEIALALVMVIPFMRYLQLQTDKRWVYRGLIGAQLLTVFAVLSTYSRAGFLAVSVVLFLMALKSRRRLVYSGVLLAAIVLLISFMPAQWSERMNTIKTYDQDASAMGRINAWSFAYNLAADRPFTGGGFKVFTRELFRKYAPNRLDHHDAHSIYFQVLAEQGYPGLIMFLALGFLTWRSGSWVIRRARDMPSMLWAGDLAAMCQVSMAGYAVGGAFAGLAYFDLPYHLMAIIVLCKELVRDAYYEPEQGGAVGEETVPEMEALEEGSAYAS
jgi:putative inorganic carbon (hco3(-)) transporter